MLLYSIGKDLPSSCIWHSRRLSGEAAFPLLHIDTTWKFREMIAFRDRRIHELGLRLIVHTNQRAWRGASARSATAPTCTPTS